MNKNREISASNKCFAGNLNSDVEQITRLQFVFKGWLV